MQVPRARRASNSAEEGAFLLPSWRLKNARPPITLWPPLTLRLPFACALLALGLRLPSTHPQAALYLPFACPPLALGLRLPSARPPLALHPPSVLPSGLPSGKGLCPPLKLARMEPMFPSLPS